MPRLFVRVLCLCSALTLLSSSRLFAAATAPEFPHFTADEPTVWPPPLAPPVPMQSAPAPTPAPEVQPAAAPAPATAPEVKDTGGPEVHLLAMKTDVAKRYI